MASRINYSGLVIAGIGFFLTRFTVALALYEDPVPFYLGGIVPLVLGLGLAAFGVALMVADIEAWFVRTTAVWCVIGAVTMLILVVLTIVATNPVEVFSFETVRSQTYLSNFLIGGSVGGTLTGLYAARNRRQRLEVHQHANRLEVLNRLLRHEVLNAVTVIKGHAALEDNTPEKWQLVEAESETIEKTIDEVRYLARSANSARQSTQTTNVNALLNSVAEDVRDEHPEPTVIVESGPDELTILVPDRIGDVFTYLIEHAIRHSSANEPTISISVENTSEAVRFDISYDGDQFTDVEQALLERGEIEQFDNPRSGFELNIARLLIENARGAVEFTDTPDGETITVILPRSNAEGPPVQSHALNVSTILPAVPQLVVVLGAALIAGVIYGILSEALGGSVAGIGVFYGAASPVVGWITHEFHSVVFGYIFLGLVSRAPGWIRQKMTGYVLIGLLWALTLWFVAAGFVAPVWLRLLGIEVAIPSFSSVLLVSHLGWGISLGVLTAWGQQHLEPRLARRLGQ